MESWWCWAGGEERVSTACTHPHEKLGEELRCALSYLTTAPAASEMGTWNLGNEDTGVKFVSTARAQSSGRRSFFFPCSFGPYLHCISPTFHDLHQQSEPFPVVLWRNIRYWSKLVLGLEPQCLLWGKSLLRPHCWITDNISYAQTRTSDKIFLKSKQEEEFTC